MRIEEKKPSFRTLVLIGTPKLVNMAIDLFREESIPIQYQVSAEGTAPSEILYALGLGTTEKSILTAVMPTTYADAMLNRLRRSLRLYIPNTGIAFTIPLNGLSNSMMRAMNTLNENNIVTSSRRDSMNESEMKYVLIAAIVNHGYSEKVMLAARSAGARGGTVVHSRQIATETTMQFWGLNYQEEKEVVLILADAESKRKIMQAISEQCGVNSEAGGMSISLPIDGVVGLDNEE